MASNLVLEMSDSASCTALPLNPLLPSSVETCTSHPSFSRRFSNHKSFSFFAPTIATHLTPPFFFASCARNLKGTTPYPPPTRRIFLPFSSNEVPYGPLTPTLSPTFNSANLLLKGPTAAKEIENGSQELMLMGFSSTEGSHIIANWPGRDGKSSLKKKVLTR